MEKRYVQNSDVTSRIQDGRIYALTSDSRMFSIEEAVGVFLWELIATEARTFDQILDGILSHFEVTREVASVDIRVFIDTLVQKGLISVV